METHKLNQILNTPWYRFFNVILFLFYFVVILISIGAIFVGYSERNLISATVECKDGTDWDATKIYSDHYSLCGICTLRDKADKNYSSCSYDEMDYSVYKLIDKQYAWTWKIVLYPLIAILIGFGIVDFLKIAVIYVFSGTIVLSKSLIIQIIKFYNTN